MDILDDKLEGKKAVSQERSSNEKKKNHKQQVELLQILTIKWIISKVTECTCYCVCVGVWSVVGVSVGGETSSII